MMGGGVVGRKAAEGGKSVPLDQEGGMVVGSREDTTVTHAAPAPACGGPQGGFGVQVCGWRGGRKGRTHRLVVGCAVQGLGAVHATLA